jgi:hypothetical protein
MRGVVGSDLAVGSYVWCYPGTAKRRMKTWYSSSIEGDLVDDKGELE